MAKYYYITYINRRLGKQFFDNAVIDEHPFEWLKRSLIESSHRKVLVNWREISKEEFRAFNELGQADNLNKALMQKSSLISDRGKDSLEGMRD